MIRAADILQLAALGSTPEAVGMLPWLAMLLPPGSLLFCSPNRSHRLMLLPFAVWAAAAGLTGARELFFPGSLSLAVALLLLCVLVTWHFIWCPPCQRRAAAGPLLPLHSCKGLGNSSGNNYC